MPASAALPPPPAPPPFPAVVGRLRAAGCVFAEDEARLLIATARTGAELDAMVDRRVSGLPLEQILGWTEFCGLRIAVEPGVFVPRRRTEFLVRQAAALLRGEPPGVAGVPGSVAGVPGSVTGEQRPVVVDLCCGSGAIGVALAAAIGGADLHAADVDPAAVACARRNVIPAGGRVYQGDLYQPLPAGLRGRVAVLAANVPYVPTGDVGLLPPEARLHEPRVALDGGADGLDVLRRVTAAAPRWLAPDGSLLAETSEGQAARALDIIAGRGLIPRLAACADMDATVVIGTRPATGC